MTHPSPLSRLFGRALKTLMMSLMVLGLWLGLGAAPALAGGGADDAIVMAPDPHVKHPVIGGLTTERVDSLHFHYDGRHAPVVDALIEMTPQIRDEIVADLSPEALSERVDIYLLPRIEDYFIAQGVAPRSPRWASGLALLGRGVILVRLDPVNGGRLELDRTMGHELSHIALHRHVGGRSLPTWFVEGFALLQTEEWNIDRAGPLADAGLAGSIIPLYELSSGFPAENHRAQLAYSESGHFVRWLIQEKGRDQFRDFTRRLGEGEKFNEAFAATYERSFFSYERQWRNTLVVEGGWIAIVVGSTTLFFATSVLFIAMYLRVRRRRKKAWAQLSSTPRPDVPDHLKNFGPFVRRADA